MDLADPRQPERDVYQGLLAVTIRADEQRLSVGSIVELFELDARAVGGMLRRFVSGPWNGAAVMYGGNEYSATPIEIDGIRFGGSLTQRPTLKISRLDAVVAAAVVGTEQWRGATLSLTRTLTRYLDGETGADPDRHWPTETWLVERMLSAGKAEVVWQLASPLDIDGVQLPGRQILRDVCAWRYRERSGGAWVYGRAECPYTGAKYFDANDDAVTDPDDDVCSRRLSGCKARFPGASLPFGGFLGVGRVRG